MNQNQQTTECTNQYKYPRLVERQKELLRLGKEKWQNHMMKQHSQEEMNQDREWTEISREEDSLAHVIEREALEIHEKIATFCKENGVKRVFDIGCAYAHQSEVFLVEDLEYVGINEHALRFWNKDQFPFITARYPFELSVEENDLAFSVLCLTWNVYLYEGEKTLIEQCEALQRDFQHCILHTFPERVEVVQRYFKKVERLEQNLYYFSNK